MDDQVLRTEHAVGVEAPVDDVFGLVADTARWSLFLPPVVHVECMDVDGATERVRTWAVMGGEVGSWVSRRRTDPSVPAVDFALDGPPAPVRTLAGRWAVAPRDGGGSLLTLRCDVTVPPGPAETATRTERAVAAYAATALDGVRYVAERLPRLDELIVEIEESARVEGPAELVFDFLHRVGDWPDLVPDVVRAEVREDRPGVQFVVTEETCPGSPGDETRVTESVRLCFPHAGRILHTAGRSPGPVAAHAGEWSLVPDETGVTVVTRHSVLLAEETVEQILGPGAGLTRARHHVRESIGRRTTTLLRLAAQHAESGIRRL